jgi:hypothetical protein
MNYRAADDLGERVTGAETLADDAALVSRAWTAFEPRRQVVSVSDISATVSTNRVFRVELEGSEEIIAKASSYGSYVHFRQDHQLIQQWIRLLGGTRFSRFLAEIVGQPGDVFTYRENGRWVVFYHKAPFYDFLPRRLTDGQIDSLARELAEFHLASAEAARRLNPTWKTVGSDIAALFDALGQQDWRAERSLSDATEAPLRAHCERFLMNAESLGYHAMPRLPVLIDWNIGNFSVGLEEDGFKFYTRWDYDWFRIEPRVLDFYFMARVVRAEGDQTLFSYFTQPLFEPRFARFLKGYHRIYPLAANDILFLKEGYRFFILNYVLRSGEHFFRPSYRTRLQKEAVEEYLPQLEAIDFTPLLAVLE